MDVFATLFTLWVIGSAGWFYTEKALALFRMRKIYKAHSKVRVTNDEQKA